jgi:hypothetical protein
MHPKRAAGFAPFVITQTIESVGENAKLSDNFVVDVLLTYHGKQGMQALRIRG